MSATPAPRKRLPRDPSLEHLRKQAKRLRRDEPALTLAAAQHRVAGEHGFASWPKLVLAVRKLAPSDGDRRDVTDGYAIDPRGKPDIWPTPDLDAIAAAMRALDVDAVRRHFLADNGHGDPLGFWARRHDPQAVATLLSGARDRLTPHLAAAFGAVDLLGELIGREPAARDADDGRGHRPLDYAAREGQSAAVALLLDRGADANRHRPLYWAAQNGFVEPVRQLLAAGATGVQAALERAVYRNRPRTVRALLDHGGPDVTGLLAPAAYGSRTGGKLRILHDLLAAGADPHHRDAGGFNALYSQIWYYGPGPDREITAFLIDAGCGVDAWNAAGLDLVEELRELLDEQPSRVNARHGPQGWTPLHFAAWGGAIGAARLLLDRAADPHALADREPHSPAMPERVRPLDLVRAPDGHFLTRDTRPLRELLAAATG